MIPTPWSRPGSGPGTFLKPVSQRPRIDAVSPNADRITGGTSITITGDRFVAGATVLFGATAATAVVVVNAQTITCNAPAKVTGLYDVTVTTLFGSDTLANSFSYVQTRITAVIPQRGTTGGGTTVVLEGANFTAAPTVTFGGVAATSVLLLDGQRISCVTPAHALGPVDVVVNDATQRGAFFYTLLTAGQDLRRQPGIVIEETNNASSKCSFTVDGQSAPPKVGEEIVFYEDDTVTIQFAGVVQTVDQIYEGQKTQLAWNVVASDYVPWLNRRRPIGTYTRVSVTDIILDLIAKYAPWVTTSHVQTGLCAVTISFDGTMDFATCLSTLMKAIGGGRWRLDYQKDLHAAKATNLNRPNVTRPVTSMSTGPGSAMTVAAGTAFPSQAFEPGYYVFCTAFEYDPGGAISQPGPFSNVIFLDGTHWPSFSNIPVGAAVGSLTVGARRIYYTSFGLQGGVTLAPYARIADNVTTTLQASATRALFSGTPRKPLVAPPIGPATLVAEQQNTISARSVIASLFVDYFASRPYFAYAPGTYSFVCTNVYADGTESQPSPMTGNITLTGNNAVRMTVPIGATLNGVPVTYRKVYGARASRNGDTPNVIDLRLWALIPNNTSNTFSIVPSVKQGNILAGPPVPSDDGMDNGCELGPDPEDANNPPDVTDTNTALLRAVQQIASSVDQTQLRNRVTVIGQGAAIAAGDVLPTSAPDAVPTGTDAYLSAVGVYTASGEADTTGFLKPPARGFPLNAFWYTEIFVKHAPKLYEPSGSTPQGDVMFGDEINYGHQTTDGSGLGWAFRDYGLTCAFCNANPYTVFMTNPDGTSLADHSTFQDVPTVDPSDDGGRSNWVPAIVRPRYQVDDEDSQRYMGAIELDDNGDPTDGIHEIVIDAGDLTTAEQCIARANAELDIYAWPIVRVTYATLDPTHPGQIVNIDLSNPPISGTFLVQSVTIDHIHEDSDDFGPVYHVTASSLKFDLDDLLLLIGGGSNTTNISAPTTWAGPAPMKAGAMNAPAVAVAKAVSIADAAGAGILQDAGLYSFSVSVSDAAMKTLLGTPVELLGPCGLGFTWLLVAFGWNAIITNNGGTGVNGIVRYRGGSPDPRTAVPATTMVSLVGGTTTRAAIVSTASFNTQAAGDSIDNVSMDLIASANVGVTFSTSQAFRVYGMALKMAIY